MKLKILAIVVLVIALVTAGYGCLDSGNNVDSDATDPGERSIVYEKPAAAISNPDGPSRINITPLSYDFGDIGFDLASHDFVVTNIGDAVLNISKLRTNCGCTTAEIDKYELYPGEEAILNVIFDPQHHMSTGHFLREAFVESNDPDNPKAKVEIQMTVVGEAPDGATDMHNQQQ